MRTHEELAQFISEKLTKKELLELTKMLDGDSLYDFIWCIYQQCEKRAPELYREAGLHFVDPATPKRNAR
jgi:hypothetical protein